MVKRFSKIRASIKSNPKKTGIISISSILIIVAIAVGSYFIYKHFYKAPAVAGNVVQVSNLNAGATPPAGDNKVTGSTTGSSMVPQPTDKPVNSPMSKN